MLNVANVASHSTILPPPPPSNPPPLNQPPPHPFSRPPPPLNHFALPSQTPFSLKYKQNIGRKWNLERMFDILVTEICCESYVMSFIFK